MKKKEKIKIVIDGDQITIAEFIVNAWHPNNRLAIKEVVNIIFVKLVTKKCALF